MIIINNNNKKIIELPQINVVYKFACLLGNSFSNNNNSNNPFASICYTINKLSCQLTCQLFDNISSKSYQQPTQQKSKNIYQQHKYITS